MRSRSVSALLAALAIVAIGDARAEKLTMVCDTKVQGVSRPQAHDVVLRIDTTANTISGSFKTGKVDFQGPVKITGDAMKWNIDVKGAGGNATNFSGELNRASGQGSIAVAKAGAGVVTHAGTCRKADGKS